LQNLFQTDEKVCAIVTARDGGDLVGYCLLNNLRGGYVVDVICNNHRVKAQDLLDYVVNLTREHNKAFVKLYAIDARILYFAKKGWVINHEGAVENLAITMMLEHYIALGVHFKSSYTLKSKVRNKNSRAVEYQKFLQLLVHLDYTKDYFAGIDRSRATEYDQNGYAMIRYV